MACNHCRRPDPQECCDRTERLLNAMHRQEDFIYQTLGQAWPRLEMFARKKRDGWDTWGNEV